MMILKSGTILSREQCPRCAKQGEDNSKDNLVVYDNGKYCYKCKYTTSDGVQIENMTSQTTENLDTREIISGSYQSMPDRGIRKDICEKYKVEVANHKGQTLIVHNFYNKGVLIDQKLRAKDNKKMQWWGLKSKTDLLFGQYIFTPSKSISVVITEGEYDAMCINQETGLPAVSVTKGATGAAKQISNNLEWILGFKTVILCFDNDPEGQQAVKDCLELFDAISVKVARFPLKDANDMVLAGRGKEIKQCLWDAETVKEPSIVCLRDIRHEVLIRPTVGDPWPWQTMTDITFGMKPAEITVVVAGTGIGKTEFIKDIIFNHIDHNQRVGVFSFEQANGETGQRLVSNYLGSKIYVPGNKDWDEDKICSALDLFDDKVYLFRHASGSMSIERLEINMKLMKNAFGINLIIIDNLTTLCAHPYIDGKRVSESAYSGAVMLKIQELTRQLNIHVIMVAHTNSDHIQLRRVIGSSIEQQEAIMGRSKKDLDEMMTPAGSVWEKGRMPSEHNILGSKNTARVADHVIGLARNKLSQDPIERRKLEVKFIKGARKNPDNMIDGFDLLYNTDTGKLEEM